MKDLPSSVRDQVLTAAVTRPSATRKTHRQRRLASMLLLLAMIVGASSLLAGSHADVPQRPMSYLVTVLAASVIVAVMAAYGTLGPAPSALGRSSRFHRLLTIATPCLLTLGALVANVLEPSTLAEQAATEMTHLLCSTFTLVAGAAVLGVLLVLERRSVTTSAAWKGASFGAVAAAWATLFISISCPYAHPVHVVPTHVWVPIIPLIVGGVVAGARILTMRADRSSQTR